MPLPSEQQHGLTDSEREWLLRVARASIAAAVLGHSSPEPDDPGGFASSPAGVFVTLHIAGELRGCIGQIGALEPLYRMVVQVARSAALRDPRFLPLSAEELNDVEIEISVLSPMAAVSAAEAERAITIGRHGIMISHGARRGLLLPQVPLHYGWDVRQFLEQTCFKAGIAGDAWRTGATVQIFTAEIFAEKRRPAYSSST